MAIIIFVPKWLSLRATSVFLRLSVVRSFRVTPGSKGDQHDAVSCCVDPDDPGLRGYAVTVEEEQHIVAWRSHATR